MNIKMDKTGVEFTESMSRLILDGKIVGRERKLFYGDKLVVHTSKSNDPLTWYFDKSIDHDSFNLGIKVGDDYIFAGDVFEVGEHYIGNSRIKPFTGTLIFTDEYCWELNNPKDSDFNVDLWQLTCGNVKYKKIGSIYEEGE